MCDFKQNVENWQLETNLHHQTEESFGLKKLIWNLHHFFSDFWQLFKDKSIIRQNYKLSFNRWESHTIMKIGFITTEWNFHSSKTSALFKNINNMIFYNISLQTENFLSPVRGQKIQAEVCMHTFFSNILLSDRYFWYHLCNK